MKVYLYIVIFEFLVLYFLSRNISSFFYSLISRITKHEKVRSYLFAIFFLPGTFFHELSHAVTAFALFVPIHSFNLLPRKVDKSITMGSVYIHKKDFIRNALVGIAPFVFGICALYFGLGALRQNDSLNSFYAYIFTGYLVFQISNSMFISREDFKGILTFLIILTTVVGTLWFLGVRIVVSDESLSFMYSISKSLSYYLLFPIGIDLGIILVKKTITENITS